jgi:hypothetical protein
VLLNAADALRVVAALIEPVMPSTTARIRKMLGSEAENWVNLERGTLKAGTALGLIEPLFPRMEHTVDELRKMADGGNVPAKGGSSLHRCPTPGPQRRCRPPQPHLLPQRARKSRSTTL